MSPGPDVVIAGGGIAAAATAIRLSSFGVRARLLTREIPPLPGIEATPLRTVELLRLLGAGDAMAAAGAVECDGMTHDWGGQTGHVAAPVLHVDRNRLAQQLLDVAVSKGARVERVPRLPPLRSVGSPPSITAVDATGRAAAWSRPLVAGSPEVAWQFEGPSQDPMAGRLARGTGWWAYRLGLPHVTWVSVVTPGGAVPPGTLGHAIRSLDLDIRRMSPRGRRRANVQRATRPVERFRIAVGDAALAHSPLAGAGIRFALASAIAAAHVMATVADDPRLRGTAVAYYERLVLTEHQRHLATLAQLHGVGADDLAPPQPDVSAAVVRFAAEIVATSLAIEGRITTGQALRLADGRTARWLGSFDLLELAQLASEPTPRILLAARLQLSGLDPSAARAVIAWSLRNGVLV